MSKAFCAIIKSVIDRKKQSASPQDTFMTINSGTTLNRMLKGVLLSASPDDAQLTEFLQLERTIQQEVS